MTLAETIVEKIKERGPISFHDFMEMSLYYPSLGYYTSRHNPIGWAGDYYTSGNLTPAFGIMIARQLQEMWELLGRNNFTIVEYGAGSGILCHDMLAYLRQCNPMMYSGLQYVIIERSPAMRERERTHLREKVSWVDSIDDISGFTGCIISNEVLDNFPVYQVVMMNELMEVLVNYEDGFTEVLRPAVQELTGYINELKVHLPKDFRTEINLDAVEWLRQIASSLKKGYLLTIDYGYPSSELYTGSHCDGTLLCYRNMQ